VIEVPTFALEDGKHSAVTEGGSSSRFFSSQKGDISEFEFCKQASLRGWRVRHMGGCEQDYDVIISRALSRALFVQVKRAHRWNGQNNYDIKNHSRGRTYSLAAYDILAAHLEDIDKWVFYTRGQLGNRKATTYMPTEFRSRATKSSAPDARDPDNWELLDQVAAMYSQESLPLGQPLSYPAP
jgi:hypothetical protein